jgi:hypothetical protein
MRTRYQRKVENLAKQADRMQLLAYNCSFEKKYDGMCFWSLHECVSLLQKYLEAGDYESYKNFAFVVVQFFEEDILPQLKKKDKNLTEFLNFFQKVKEIF